MPEQISFNCAATMIGSVMDTDPDKAWKKISKYLTDLPAWPQLSMRTNVENVYIQYSEGFAGIHIDGHKISFHHDNNFDEAYEKLVNDYYDGNLNSYAISSEYSAGLHHLSTLGSSKLPIIKGQIIGPVSWGLCVTEEAGRGIVYDETLADAVSRFLKLKAQWLEQYLKTIAGQTVIFVDEPYLASLGSAFVALSEEKVASLITDVLSGIKGIKGIHCCGGTDWSQLLRLPIDILSFDAYNYMDSILCYEKDLTSFIKNGKTIAWGIVPNDEETLKKESVPALFDRFCETLAPLTRKGIPIKQLIRQSIITPTCGLASLSSEAEEEVLALLAQLSEKVRQKYSLK